MTIGMYAFILLCLGGCFAAGVGEPPKALSVMCSAMAVSLWLMALGLLGYIGWGLL